MREKLDSIELYNIINTFGVGLEINRRKNESFDNYSVED